MPPSRCRCSPSTLDCVTRQVDPRSANAGRPTPTPSSAKHHGRAGSASVASTPSPGVRGTRPSGSPAWTLCGPRCVRARTPSHEPRQSLLALSPVKMRSSEPDRLDAPHAGSPPPPPDPRRRRRLFRAASSSVAARLPSVVRGQTSSLKGPATDDPSVVHERDAVAELPGFLEFEGSMR